MIDKQQIIEARHIAVDLNVSDLNNPEWHKAKPVQIDRYWSGESAPKSRHAETRALWSKNALHLRFLCNQDEPLVVSDKPKTDKKTMGLWDRDVCEVFLQPRGSHPHPRRAFCFMASSLHAVVCRGA